MKIAHSYSSSSKKTAGCHRCPAFFGPLWLVSVHYRQAKVPWTLQIHWQANCVHGSNGTKKEFRSNSCLNNGENELIVEKRQQRSLWSPDFTAKENE